MKKKLSRTRRAVLPHLPKNVKEVHSALASLDIKTSQGEEMLQVKNEEKNIVCFSSDSNL